MKFVRSSALAAAAVLALATTEASAVTFTFDNGGGNGTGSSLGPTGAYEFQLALTSNDNGTGGIFTTFTATAGEWLSVYGDWNYGTSDVDGSTFDTLGYFIDDVYTTLVQLSTNGIPAPAFQTGTFSFSVAAGQNFGFYMLATDGILGGANGTILGNTSPIPLPAGGFLLIGALGGLAVFRRRKTA